MVVRLRTSLTSSLFRNSFFLLVRTFLVYALGLAFWFVVARLYTTAEMGIAAALLSVLLLLARGAALGLPTSILRFLPSERDKIGLLNAAFTLSAIAALLLGGAFLMGMDVWAADLVFIRSDALLVVAVLASVTFFTLDGVLDNAFVAARRADLGLVRTSIFHGLRIPLVAAFVLLSVSGIVVSWTLSLVISVVGAGVLLPRLYPGYRPSLSLRRIRTPGLRSYSFWSYAGGLVGGAGAFLMPLLILNTIGSGAGAVAAGLFYAAYTIATFLYSVPHAFSTSLLVEGSHTDTDYATDVRKTVRFSAPLLALGIAGAILLGRLVLAAFGEEYAERSYDTLVLLALASPILLASNVLATKLRVEKRVRPIFFFVLLSTTATLVTAYALIPALGIFGAAVGVVVGQASNLALFIAEREWRRRKHAGANGSAG